MFPRTRQQTHTSKKGSMEASVEKRRVDFLCHKQFITTRVKYCMHMYSYQARFCVHNPGDR